MRDLAVTAIGAELERLVSRASFELGSRELCALERARDAEREPTARSIMQQLVDNAAIARAERRPLCQDTGVAVVFLDIGQEVHLTGGDLETAVHAAIARAYADNFLRKSLVRHPLVRKNTGDNTPAVIHTRIVPGDRVRIRFDAKGGGCENMSRVAMLMPSDGRAGVIRAIVETVRAAGGNPCPPVIVGVGLGGTFEKAALLAKEALLRPLGDPADDPFDAELETELFAAIQATNVGPQGFGGQTTALAVHVISHPCHIASLPVAINIDCHSHRHAEAVL